jgi:hypothetical protein
LRSWGSLEELWFQSEDEVSGMSKRACDVCGHETAVLDYGTGEDAEKMGALQ